jgi:hypothetical protein
MNSSSSYSISDIESFASKFYQGRPLLLTPYAYVLTFSSLAANTSATQTLSITANADFIFTMMHHRATSSAYAGQTVSTKVAPLARILITDSGTNEQFTNAAVDLENYSTNGNIVNDLPYPRIVSGRSTLTIQLSSYEASATINVDLSLEGVLVRAFTG